MISFKQFLIEAKSAPLYHATSYDNFNRIVDQNTLKTTAYGMGQRSRKPTNFFTRSIKNSKEYAHMVHGLNHTVIIQIDQLKLSQRYKILPIHNWYQDYYDKYPTRKSLGSLEGGIPYGTEFEEVVDKDITNFLSYITRIYIRNSEEIKPKIRDILEKYNIPVEEIK